MPSGMVRTRATAVPAGRADFFVSPRSSLVHTHVHSEPSPTVTYGVTPWPVTVPRKSRPTIRSTGCPDGLFEVELDSELGRVARGGSWWLPGQVSASGG